MQTLEIEPTYRVVLPPVAKLTVMLVGVGGTGSGLAPALARLAYQLRGKGVTVKLLFVDYDTVETKNVDGSSSVPQKSAPTKLTVWPPA